MFYGRKRFLFFVISILIAAVFIPDLYNIVLEVAKITYRYPRNAWQNYNSVKAAFCVVILLLFGFSVYSGILAIRLWRK